MNRINRTTTPVGVLLAGLIGAVLLFSSAGCPPIQECTVNADCDDGVFCNGVETCVNGRCQAGTDPCAEGETCDEENDECLTPCDADADCDDQVFCNGAETCVDGACQPGTDPCAADETCDEENDECVPPVTPCETDADCLEGEFCDAGACVANENLFASAEFDHDMHSGAFACESCHHEEGGFATCVVCHNRDEVVGGIPVLKDVMHHPTVCWQCHSGGNPDGTTDCSLCHTALDDL